MKKQTIIIVMLTILSFLLVTWIPCQADDVLCGCAKIKKGTLRIIDCSSQCLKSEYPVTLNGTSPQNQNPVPSFSGELCWSILVTEDAHPPADGGTFLTRVRVTYMGGADYLIQGVVTISNNNPVILDGTGVIVGNEIFITLNTTRDDSSGLKREGALLQMRLDISTLSGTFWNISDEFNTVTREFDHSYSAGTVTLTTCPD